MFDLEQSIAGWRTRMLVAGIEPGALDELESHLRDEVRRQASLDKDLPYAFDLAVKQIGGSEPLACEYKKLEAFGWNRPLAWTAWIIFVVSFFLPAIHNGWGWQCAVISLTALSWSGPWNLGEVYLTSLTLANLLMISSPWLLPLLSRNARSLKWFRLLSLSTLALVWLFILKSVIHDNWKGLLMGCYVWGLSFVLLYLSTVKLRTEKPIPRQYV